MSTTPEPPPAAPSKWAANQTELGNRLVPPRERKTIQRALKLPGCPGRTADGRYDVPKWQTWIETVGPIGQVENGQGAAARTPAMMRKTEEQVKLIEIQRRQREFDYEVNRGRYILREDATRDAAKKFSEVRQALLQLPGVLAPVVIACVDAPAAELKLREAIVKALRALADPAPAVPLPSPQPLPPAPADVHPAAP